MPQLVDLQQIATKYFFNKILQTIKVLNKIIPYRIITNF